jgi:hypothetical protein
MLMRDAFDSRSGSRMPYGMATITIEMAMAPWLRDEGASWLRDQCATGLVPRGNSQGARLNDGNIAAAVVLLWHDRVSLA